MPFLQQLVLNDQIRLWDDRLIGTGENWYVEIADRMQEAKVAILLVTPNFLASKFCKLEEIPVLLQRARAGEIKVLPLLAEPCFWENEPWLKRIQMWPADGKALSERRPPKRKTLLVEFTRRVLNAIESPRPKSTTKAQLDDPKHPTHNFHRMPQTGSLLFGRSHELNLLDDAWSKGANLIAFTAGGGVGKSTLVRVWAEHLADDNWRGAERLFAWSFYSQGTGRMTDSENFISEALTWFGESGFEHLSIQVRWVWTGAGSGTPASGRCSKSWRRKTRVSVW